MAKILKGATTSGSANANDQGYKPIDLQDIQGAGYNSKYEGMINQGVKDIVNKQDFTYDPLKDVNYQAMAKMYNKQGEQAAKNTMADAASLNGGFGTSYAQTAAQQVRNDYNQQLSSQIPALYENAYNRYLNDYNMDMSTLQMLQGLDDSMYGRYRDTVGDNMWLTDFNNANQQWWTNYNRSVLESNRDYDFNVWRANTEDEKWTQEYAATFGNGSNGSSGGSGSSGSSGGRSYISSGGGGTSDDGGGKTYEKIWNDNQELDPISQLWRSLEETKNR